MDVALPAGAVATDRERHLLAVASCDQFQGLAGILEMTQLFAGRTRARGVISYLYIWRRKMGVGSENHQGEGSQIHEIGLVKLTFGLAPKCTGARARLA